MRARILRHLRRFTHDRKLLGGAGDRNKLAAHPIRQRIARIQPHDREFSRHELHPHHAYYEELPPIKPTTRPEAIERLREDLFDVLIIGGGINGAGTARDLALRAKVANRPLKIALVERNHFASGTSSRNSHLIHGGLRYLKMLDFHLVREALRERSILLRIAPHLVEPLAFLLPVAGFAREFFYNTGLTIYDTLATGDFPKHRRIPLPELLKMEPDLALTGMTGAIEYYDAQVRSARLVLENVFEAVANGATCANYVAVETHQRDGAQWRVQLREQFTNNRFEARAKTIIDATGPWAHDPAPRLVRGSHIVVPRLNSSDRAIAYFEESGRIIFFIPWGERGDRTLIGTTDVDHDGPPDDVHISKDEIAYLRSMAARVFPASARVEPLASFSALRPLLTSHASATRATREHHIYEDNRGVIRITGGKFTTYRSMSEEATDLVAETVAPPLKELHVTAEVPLNGNSAEEIANLRSQVPSLASKHGVEPGEIIFLIGQYGVLAPAVLGMMPSQPRGGLSRIDAARLKFAILHEMAQRPENFLEISTTLGLEGSAVTLPDEDWRA